jgi:FkbM family methyltransferase
MNTYVQGRKTSAYSKIFKIILNRINHVIARKNIEKNPQLVIFSFDHIGLSLNLEGRYENSSLLLVEEFIERKIANAKDKIALDIGANIGNHSIFFAKTFKQVYAFEPNPVTYEVLKINSNYAAEHNNVIPVNFGLSDIEGSLPFYINPSNIGGSTIIDGNNPHIKNSTQINVKTLDTLNELKDVSLALIKIDVEGHELNVLKGAKKTISREMPAILFEQGIAEIIDGSSPVIDYLDELGYEFFEIKKNFDFGDKLIYKIFSLVCTSLFGERLDFVNVKTFRKKFYDMILAMPKS